MLACLIRFYLDAGVVFIGHGLKKDFETANLFVPSENIRDTVELWRLPHQRKISLRFLTFYFLREDIQGEVHDSIEDAKTALMLYRHYELVRAKGAAELDKTLRELYEFGNRTNWTIGLTNSPSPKKKNLSSFFRSSSSSSSSGSNNNVSYDRMEAIASGGGGGGGGHAPHTVAVTSGDIAHYSSRNRNSPKGKTRII